MKFVKVYILKIVSIIPGIDEDNSFVICKWIENIIVYVNLLKNIVVLKYKILNIKWNRHQRARYV